MTQHSKGPFKAGVGFDILDGDGHAIGWVKTTLRGDTEELMPIAEVRANQTLFTAAPDLLHALEVAIFELEARTGYNVTELQTVVYAARGEL